MEERKLLIVEDDAALRQLLRISLEGLEDEGVRLLIAQDGQQALDAIQAERPNLVLLDVMMPKLTGFQVCEIVKHEWGYDDVYIILLTSKGQESDVARGKASGADLFMTKPFDPDGILHKAREILGLL